MPVFLSHRKADKASALKIYAYLESNKIKCYIDEFDEALQRSKNITDVIMSRISGCSHLMAIMSYNTSGSWWVPFEVGVASEADRRICSYKIDSVSLPEYLDIWPIMTTPEHLAEFVKLYNNDSSVLLEKSESFRAAYASVKSSGDFHRMLKSATGQR